VSRYTYEAVGSVRGGCGHAHRSPYAAHGCALEDRRACASLPGGNAYSDRLVRRSDGAWMVEVRPGTWMTKDEWDELDEEVIW
jgi:hypothetical protein